MNRGEGPNFLFRNEDSVGFERILEGPLVAEGLSASMACWADIDVDGDLDVLLVGYRSSPNMIFINLGDGRFEPVNDTPLSSGQGEGRACACGDANNDRLPDFILQMPERRIFITKTWVIGNLKVLRKVMW